MTVDVMIPFYGSVDLLKEAVNSVLAQTDPDWRLVVIDDVYPDETVGQWFAGLEDERVTYLRNETNLGSNGNFRKCVDLAENELVVIMGCDDVLMPHYVEWLKSAAEKNPQGSIFQPGVVVIDETGAESNTLVEKMKAVYRPNASTVLTGEDFAVSLLRGNWLYFPSIGWRKEVLDRYSFRPGYEIVLDLALELDIAMGGGSLVYDETPAFKYRRHSSSYSSSTALDGSRFDEERDFFNLMAQEMDALGWKKAARTARQHFSSRLHAATLVPKAVLGFKWNDLKTLANHIVR